MADPTGRPAAVITDMEGVLVVDWQPLPGASAALGRLRAAGLPVVVLTNTTGRSRKAICTRLTGLGMPVEPGAIVTAASATAGLVAERYPNARVHLLAEAGAAEEFAGQDLVADPAVADVIVIGGPHSGWGYDDLNACFRALIAGTPLVAMQRNRWWPTGSGPAMDAGGFVAALEYAAGVVAEVVGKPSPGIFREALSLLSAQPAQTLMIGDDLDSDLRPAAALGMRTCLVRTGKGASFTLGSDESTREAPDLAVLVAALLR